jgi:hypothetical protein
LHAHGIGGKCRITLPTILSVYFSPHFEYFFQGEHIILLVSEQSLDSISEHIVLLVDSVSQFYCHFSQPLKNPELTVVIVVEVVLLREGFEGLESADNFAVIFCQNVVGREQAIYLFAESLVLYLQLRKQVGSVVD